MLPVQKDDGLPPVRLEPHIDSVGFRFYLRHQILIASEVAAAWSANLHECELALIGGYFSRKRSMAKKRSRMPFV